MSSLLRRISTQRLVALCVAMLAVVATGAAIAVAATSGGPVPERKPLANAVHDAITAPEVEGVTARIEFTNNLVDNVDFRGWNPIIGGGSGRLWATDDGRFRLELQSQGGDAQVVSDGKRWWAYDGESETVYRGTVPEHHRDHGDGARAKKWQPPTVARIQRVINRVTRKAAIAGPTPTNIGGEPAYNVRLEPKRYGGLLSAVEFAWDAAHGAPLRGAVYAKGDSEPVLALEATEIEFGKVATSTFEVPPPNASKVERVRPHEHGDHDSSARKGKRRKPITGEARVERRTGFDVSAPAELEGRKRQEVVLLGRGKKGKRAGALVTYGHGLDGIAVVQRPATQDADDDGPLGGAELPTVAIGDVTGQVLSTPLGTAVRFERGGIRYVVVASAERSVVEAAARGL